MMRFPVAHSTQAEWSAYYHLPGDGVEALHARFVQHHYSRHAHDYLVVGLVRSGAQSFNYRGARHVTAKDQVFLVNVGEPHTGEAAASDGYLYQTLYPGVRSLTELSRDIGFRETLPTFKDTVLDDPQLTAVLTRCHASISQRNSRAECELLTVQALAHLIVRFGHPRGTADPPGKKPVAVRCAREYLEHSYADDIALSELAARVSLSPYYFARAFERSTGLPPHAYLDGVRIRKARELIHKSEPLACVAHAVGYSDQSHFTRRFKRHLGITPGQYAAALGD
jgi:AraC-like DNA-binding protein